MMNSIFSSLNCSVFGDFSLHSMSYHQDQVYLHFWVYSTWIHMFLPTTQHLLLGLFWPLKWALLEWWWYGRTFPPMIVFNWVPNWLIFLPRRDLSALSLSFSSQSRALLRKCLSECQKVSLFLTIQEVLFTVDIFCSFPFLVWTRGHQQSA